MDPIVVSLIAAACIVMAIVNVLLVLERKRLRRPRGPQMVYGEPDTPADELPARKPERDPSFVEQELERVKSNLRQQFPGLGDGEVARAAKEIVEKARLTLARIP